MTMKWNASDVAISDIEGNGLLYELTRFHCGVVLNPFTLVERVYVPSESTQYLADLDAHGVVVGHNFRGYDLLALDKLFDYRYAGFCFDTLVLSRLLNPEQKFHSLEHYGRRFKFLKGDYKIEFKKRLGPDYIEGMEWWDFNQPMLDYCVQDVRLNAVLFLKFVIRLEWWDWFGVTKEQCLQCIDKITKGEITRETNGEGQA